MEVFSYITVKVFWPIVLKYNKINANIQKLLFFNYPMHKFKFMHNFEFIAKSGSVFDISYYCKYSYLSINKLFKEARCLHTLRCWDKLFF